jgi:hypothetical protein
VPGEPTVARLASFPARDAGGDVGYLDALQVLGGDAAAAFTSRSAGLASAAGVRESISLTGQFAAVDEILSGRGASSW